MQLKVFISSRLQELEGERTAVEKAVSELWIHENLPFTVWRWESAKDIPSGKHPDKVQSKGVRDSDIYVLILGSEYGDFEYEGSPTHREYKTACSELEEDCILIYIKEVERREEKLEKWIEEIKNKHTFKSFVNTYQLKDLVKTRLRDLWNKGKWKVSMPTIQSVLRKGETFEGAFFKKEPEWIDFEEGFVVERKEEDEIMRKLETDPIQLVLGEPASGKSVILKNIGFKLAKENRNVYVVELKKHSRDKVKRYFEDIPEITDEKAVFIVDDAHLYLSNCESLLREFKNRNLKEKLIIGSRETREIRGERPKEVSEFEYLSKTDIHAEDVTEEMIRRFLKGKYNFSDERIKAVSKNLEKYKKDMWHLSWALKAYNPKKDSVEEEEIYKKIRRDSIREIKFGKDESGKNKYLNAEDVFFPLSVFYRFEISVERDFLEEQLEIEEYKINQLIELSEIIETEEIGRNRMLSLNHSSIADLYFKTYQAFPSLGGKTKKRILNQTEKDLEYRLFYKYMTSTDPRNAIDVVYRLRENRFYKKERRALLKKLIEDVEIQKSIEGGIEKEEDIEKIGLCLHIIVLINKEVGSELANRINIDLLSSKIEKEEDLEKITWFISINERIGLKLINYIDILSLKFKIEKEGNLRNIGGCIEVIARENTGMALKLLDAFSNRIEKEEDIVVIGIGVWLIARVSKEMALKGVNISLSKIEKEGDIEKVGECVRNIARGSEEVALKLVSTIAPKIEKEKDIIKIIFCMNNITYGSNEVALRLVDAVSSRMEKEEDVIKITQCIEGIALGSEEVAREITSRLNPKLREELQGRWWLK